MKKTIVLVTLLTGLFSTLVPVYAYSVPAEAEAQGDISTYAEETEWYFRTVNGVHQKRLWSITEGKWLTDWINCTV